MNFDFLYSDPHFGHQNIIKYANRPFTDANEMNRELVKRYNEVVQKHHTVLWMGDCTFRWGEQFHIIMKKLNGKKLLILGNHDKSKRQMLSYGFEAVMDGPVHWREKYILSHYPPRKANYMGERSDVRYYDRRPAPHPGEIVIHGHTHEKIQFDKNRIHVGVDAWDYYPVPLEKVLAFSS